MSFLTINLSATSVENPPWISLFQNVDPMFLIREISIEEVLLGRLLRDELAFAKSKTWTMGMGYTHSYTATCPSHSGQLSPSTSRPKPPTVPPHYHIITHHSFILLRLASSCLGHRLVFFIWNQIYHLDCEFQGLVGLWC